MRKAGSRECVKREVSMCQEGRRPATVRLAVAPDVYQPFVCVSGDSKDSKESVLTCSFTFFKAIDSICSFNDFFFNLRHLFFISVN